MDTNFFQYAEILRTQHQGDLREVNRRLTQIALENRMRENRTGAIIATIAQLTESNTRPAGGNNE
jgi:hypothetical protein